MRKLIVSLSLVLVAITMQAQDFSKYENMREVDAMVVTSNMFKLLAEIDVDSDDPEVKRYMQLIENLENIRVISTSNQQIGEEMLTDMNKYIANNALEKLMMLKEDGKNVKFYSKPGSKKNYVRQLVMLLSGQEEGKPITVALSITGDIDIKEVSRLAKDLDVPGAEQLKKVENK
ncbi:DUF4252 domain-containing protein [Haloflavibacter putidus]|uniref:DUF4252 domain-containing protein n=1 Tax=Haloflavibacter putidus TaxID=2576776 RepID=A0A507ZNL9_9FLAO|nr:DUF4252 domain-containing protein [Haloflavibacter putidus]TQD39130.1 DUF4252 domain-containing protein [Haloflavibacter putidus]